MAISIVQNPVTVVEADASVTRAWVSTPTAGNLLVAIGRGSNVITNASMSGWTLAVSCLTGATRTLGIWLKVAGASEGDVTLDWTSSTSTYLVIMEWSGLTAAVLDKVAKTDTTGSAVTSRSSGTTATPTANEELIIAAVGQGGAVTSLTWTNSYTNLATGGGTDIFWSYLIQSTAAAQETTASWTTARVAGGCIATFKAGGFADLTGAAAITFAGMTASGAGKLDVAGALASTFGGMTLGGVGNTLIYGVLAQTLSNMTLAGAGTVASGTLPTISGAAAITFAGMTLSGAGNNIIQGTSSLTFVGMTLASAGRVDIAAALASTFIGMTSSASGTVLVQGAAAITFGDMTLTGAGTVTDVPPITGSLSITFDSMTLAGTGDVTGSIPVPAVVTGAGSPLWMQLFRKQEQAIIDEEEEILVMAMML